MAQGQVVLEVENAGPSRIAYAHVLVAAVFISLLILTLYYVHMFASPVPIADDWANVPCAVGEQSLTIRWLWSLHNEHRLFIPRLMYVGLMRLTRFNVLSLMYLDVFILAGLALLWINTSRKIAAGVSASFVFFPLTLLNLGQYENLLWAFQIGFICSVLISTLVLLQIITLNGSFRQLLSIGLCLILLPLCGASGLAFVPILIVWLALTTVHLFRKRLLSRLQTGLLLLTCLGAALLSGLYLIGFHSQHPGEFRWDSLFRACLEFLSISLGPAARASFLWYGGLVLFIVAVSTFLLARAYRMRPEERLRVPALAAWLGAFFSLTISIAIGRGLKFPGWGLAERYMTLSVPVLCFSFAAFLRYSNKRWSQILTVGLVILTGFLYPQNMKLAVGYGMTKRAGYAAFVSDLQAGVPLEAVTARNLRQVFPFYEPMVDDFFRILNVHKIGPFGDHSAMPAESRRPFEERSILPQPQKDVNEIQFVFREPLFVDGVRFTYVITQPEKTQGELRMSWLYDAAESSGQSRYDLLFHLYPPLEQTRTVWFFGKIKELRIELNGKDVPRPMVSQVSLILPHS